MRDPRESRQFRDHRDLGGRELRDDDLDHANSRQIRDRIRDTRARLDRTVDEVVDRLRPRSLANELADSLGFDGNQLRSRVMNVGGRVVDQMSQHAAPAALIGVGIVWLAIASRRDAHEADIDDEPYVRPFDRERYGFERDSMASASMVSDSMASDYGTDEHGGNRLRRALQRGQQAVERGRSAAGRAARSLQRGVRGARDGGRRTMEASRDAMRRASGSVRAAADKVRDVYDSSPLALGLGAAAAGIVCGLLLPRTRSENRAMGEWADDVKDRAREGARRAGQRAAEVASEAGAAAVEAAGDRVDRELERTAKGERSPTNAEQRGSDQRRAPNASPSATGFEPGGKEGRGPRPQQP